MTNRVEIRTKILKKKYTKKDKIDILNYIIDKLSYSNYICTIIDDIFQNFTNQDKIDIFKRLGITKDNLQSLIDDKYTIDWSCNDCWIFAIHIFYNNIGIHGKDYINLKIDMLTKLKKSYENN